MAGRHHTALGYCDEVDIENFLLIDIDNTFSAQVEDWIATAESVVNSYLNYTTTSGILREQITGEVVKAYVDGGMNLKIFPRKIPIVSISQIQIIKGTSQITLALTDGLGNTKYQIPSSNDYISYPDYELGITGNSVINSFAQLRGTEFFVKLNYIAGYATVPPDIRLATVNFVADYIMRHANKEGLEQITQGRVTKRWRNRRQGNDPGYSDFYLDAIQLLNGYQITSAWLI